MKKHLPLFVFLTALLAIAATVSAQDAPTITIRKSDIVNLAVGEITGAQAAAVRGVLINDLTISGLFDLSDAARATFSVKGSVDTGRLEGLVLDGTGATVLKKSYTGDVRSVAHQFADDIVETLTGKKGIASTKIAFVSTRSGSKEIYIADYDGANVKQLTNDRAISVAPALSPDGRVLAYTGYQSGYADIYTVDLASGARKRIVKFPGTNSGAAFSPDGGRIACTLSKDGNPELYVVSASGGGARRLTRTRGVESSPTWSPDGSEIIYSSDDGGSPRLFRIASAGGVGSAIPTGMAYNTEPNWSPDGRKIAFVTRAGGFSIAVKDLASGGTTTLGPGTDPVWGANSRHILFAENGGERLILLDTQNRKTYPVVSGLGKVSEPTWSRGR
jgi:TolB protein